MKKTILLTALLAFSFSMSTVFAQWQPTNGPAGGYVRNFIFSDSIVIAATGGGPLATTSEGSSWAFRTAGLTSCDSKSFAKIGRYVFLSTDEDVFRSTNNGITWEPAGTVMDGKYVKTITAFNNVLFAGTYLRGIYRSTDSGATWTAVNNGMPAKYVYWLAADDSNIYAGTYTSGMYRSSDTGSSWTAINTGLTDPSIMTVTAFGGKIFAGTLSSGVFVSTNKGNSFAALGTSIMGVKGFTALKGVLYAGSYGGGVYKSLDTGRTWTQVNSGLSETEIWSIGSSDSVLYVGVTSGHVYRSINYGASWSLCNSSNTFKACVGSIVSSGTTLDAGSHGSCLFTSSTGGSSWTPTSTISTVEIRSEVSYDSLVFAGTDMLGIFKSTNNGTSFANVNTGLTSNWIQSFTFCGTKVFAGSGEAGVFLTINDGSSWSPVNTGLGCLNVTALASDGVNVFAGTADSGVYVTANYGSIWSPVNNGLSSKNITALSLMNGYLFAGTKADGIFVSTNSGTNWNPASNGLPSASNIRCLYAYETSVFTGTGTGEVFASFDNGNDWVSVSDGLVGAPVLSLCSSGSYLYAGINAGGVWERPLSELTGIKEIIHDIGSIIIFPNPTTDIFTIEAPPQAIIEITSIQGQHVKTLATTGNKTNVDVSELPGGVYVVEVKTEKGVSVSKFIKE